MRHEHKTLPGRQPTSPVASPRRRPEARPEGPAAKGRLLAGLGSDVLCREERESPVQSVPIVETRPGTCLSHGYVESVGLLPTARVAEAHSGLLVPSALLTYTASCRCPFVSARSYPALSSTRLTWFPSNRIDRPR